MCDTYVCLATSSKDDNVIFGKNSDRLSAEAQLITYAPRTNYTQGEELKCTHISIPQVSETAAVILSQPYWIWGAEMGANEYDVVIGNEAVATKEPLKDTGLLGMDLLRLGLERGKTAKEALSVITQLLENHGQGGAHNKKGFNYHNSFIIADPEEAIVLETAGDWWIMENVKDFRSISNDISIRSKGDMRRDGIINHAIENDYCKDDTDFDFAITFSAPTSLPSYMDCSMSHLTKRKGEITPSLMMGFLRDHDGNICRHKRSDQTNGSQVSYLNKNSKSIHWFTGSNFTCLSIYKPYAFPIEGQRVLESKPYSELDPEWFWSRHNNHIKPFARHPNRENIKRDVYQKTILRFEERLTYKINNFFYSNKEKNAPSSEEFINKIKIFNDLAWKESEEMIT
jgi:secernin